MLLSLLVQFSSVKPKTIPRMRVITLLLIFTSLCCLLGLVTARADAAVLLKLPVGGGAESLTPPANNSMLSASAPGAIALGAYIYGAREDPKEIDKFASLVGGNPAVVMWFQSWATVYRTFNPSLLDAVVARGASPVISWMPGDINSLRDILNGSKDTYIRSWARAAAAWTNGKNASLATHSLYIRFAHEMNADWYPWGIGVHGNTAADYINAWRRVVDIFRQEGASRVQWIWSPVVTTLDRPFAAMYPGDSYVDWVALDGYNPGTSRLGGSWRSIVEIFSMPWAYPALAALTNKPMMIAEMGSSEMGGNKSAWIQTGLNDLPTLFPRVRALLWFQENKETDWRVNSSSAALDAYKGIVRSPQYQGRLP